MPTINDIPALIALFFGTPILIWVVIKTRKTYPLDDLK